MITKQIWKFPMGISTTHMMPRMSEFLCVQMQGEVAMAWFMVMPSPDEQDRVCRKFKIYETGHDIPLNLKYLGTYQSPPFVWHLFEEI